MTQREILLYYSLKFKGNWDKISEAVASKEEIDQEDAEKLIKSFKGNYITALDKGVYPEYLYQAVKPPFVLYYRGDISLLSQDYERLAVVGSRKFSDYGKEVTENFVSELAKDFVIVSGLAIGIDAIAHASAIKNNGKTIAVLGNGIDFCYLLENQELYEEIATNHLVISEYPPEVQPCPEYFPVRNRIIAALCDNLLVTEGKLRSGTQITACLMVNKGGNVCCVPTRIDEESICNHLISEGAFLVESPRDIIEISGVRRKRPIFEK